MIRVLEILPGQQAVVSTHGLCRIVVKETRETVAELVDAPTAASLVDFMGQPEWGEPSEAIPYDALCQSASS